MARSEILAKRTKRAKHFRNDDGTFTAEFSTGQLHYQDSFGNWHERHPNLSQLAAEDFAAEENGDIRVRAFRNSGQNRFLDVTHRSNGRGLRYQLPAAFTVDGDRVRFTWDGLNWSYLVTATGVKLQTDPIASTLGPKTYQVQIASFLGGMGGMSVDTRGNLSNGEVTILRPVVYDGNGNRVDVGPWSLQGSMASFTFDDTAIVKPYVIDPQTTFNLSTSANDQRVWRTGATYPPSGANTWEVTETQSGMNRSQFSASNWQVGFLLVAWDTSSLSGNTPTGGSVSLQNMGSSISDAELQLVAEYYNWDGTSSTDYNNAIGNNAHSGTTTNTIAGGVFSLTLSSTSGISTTGTTKMRIGQNQRAGDAAPTGPNYIDLAQFDHATAQEPRLIVDYTVGGGGPQTWDFTGTNGAAWPSPWSKISAGTTTVDIQSNRGRLLKGTTAWDGAQVSYGTVTDFEFAGEFLPGTTATQHWIITRFRVTGGNSYYSFEFDPSVATGSVYLKRWASGVDQGTLAGSDTNVTFSTGTARSFRLRVVGSSIKYRTWATGATEPSTWDVQVTDATLTTGGLDIMLTEGTTAAVSGSFDNLSMEAVDPYNLAMHPNAALTSVSGWSGAFTDIDEASASPDSSYLEPV